MEKYDIIIIGSGAGLMVMEEALNHGLKCAIIEKSKFGGTCLNKGCIPSKMLVYPADFIRETETSKRIGITASAKFDWDVISQRMWEQINFNEKIEKTLAALPNLTVYKGEAKFTSPNSLKINFNDQQPPVEIQGDKIIIGAGARSQIPYFKGLEETGYVVSETFFGEKFPKKPWESLVIIGGGAISMEFAHIFSSFGTKVTIIIRSERILNKEEEEVSDFVAKQLIKNGIEILTNTNILSIEKNNGSKVFVTENKLTGEQKTVSCQEIFVASGIVSNSDVLDLDKAEVETNEKGWIITNSYLETSQKNIWALGDINGKFQFRHKANYEAQILSHNLFNLYDNKLKEEVSYSAVPWTVFTHPQVSHLGMTEKELKELNIPYKTAVNHYSEVVGGRAMGYRDNDDDNGFIKMIIGENKKILGVHIVGPQSAILLQPFVYLMNSGYKCNKKEQWEMGTSGTRISQIQGLRIMCPHIGTYTPINNSMVTHPSLNELTAWVFEKFNYDEENL